MQSIQENERERYVIDSTAGDASHILKLTVPVKMRVSDLNVYYGSSHAIKHVSMEVADREVTALMGPSGCGKSTFLRALNRMHDLTQGARVTGSAVLDNTDLLAPGQDVVQLRQRVGMVFQRPNPFPKSIFDNVAFGARINGIKGNMHEIVERSLRQAALWEEVKNDVKKSALALSGGQQQRLCIARALAVQPDVILMDEPCSALDPIATLKIEDLIRELTENYTIVIVTHNMQQAARVSDYTAFMLAAEHGVNGQLIEYGPTTEIFTNPRDKRTEDYITGRFG